MGTVQGMGAALAKLGKTGGEVSYVGHGMTTATNAVIQRKGAKIAFVGPPGFTKAPQGGPKMTPFLQRRSKMGGPMPNEYPLKSRHFLLSFIEVVFSLWL